MNQPLPQKRSLAEIIAQRKQEAQQRIETSAYQDHSQTLAVAATIAKKSLAEILAAAKQAKTSTEVGAEGDAESTAIEPTKEEPIKNFNSH